MLAVQALEIAEHQGPVSPRVKGVGFDEGVRHHVQLMAVEAPANPAPQGHLEARQGAHDHRVHVLAMECRIAQQRLARRIERVDHAAAGGILLIGVGVVQLVARGIEGDHLQAVAGGAQAKGFQRHADPGEQQLAVGITHRRVLGEDGEGLAVGFHDHGQCSCAPGSNRRNCYQGSFNGSYSKGVSLPWRSIR
ncbi:hypothetical protein D3C76_1183870 [compost metagenome]